MKKTYIKPTVITIVVKVQKTILAGSPGISVSENVATWDDDVLSRESDFFWDDEDE